MDWTPPEMDDILMDSKEIKEAVDGIVGKPSSWQGA